MDSLTQIVLGASVGEAVLGSRAGPKAAFWGAVCGILPDLDAFVPFDDPVASFTYHRSFSHSLLVLAVLSPLMVWMIRKIHPGDARHHGRWYLLVYLAFATHALLDSFTIYGTQIFWPVDTTPMTWGSVFIIDPLYSLPLAVGVIAVLTMRRSPRRAHRVNLTMLALTTLYLGWSLAVKYHAHRVAAQSLQKQSIEYRRLVALASPFNTVLWRLLAMDEDGYYVGWYSLLDERPEIRFSRYPSEPGLLDGIEDHWPVRRLQWFTKGFYRVRLEGDDIVMTDLRMGLEDAYVFSFKVGETSSAGGRATPGVARDTKLEFARLGWLWRRLKGLD